MNRILVIGATGNVGRQVVSQLAAAGAQVRVMVRNPDAVLSKNSIVAKPTGFMTYFGWTTGRATGRTGLQ